MLQNIPCFDIVPMNFICNYLILHCRRNAPTLFPRRGNNREDDIFPYADVPHRTQCVFCGTLTTIAFVGVVRRAANQNPMIAGGDHSITLRISSARQRGKFLSRTELAPQCNDVAKCTMFRHDITEFRLQMFDTTIVGAMRRRCFPAGETTGKMISSPTKTYRIVHGA